MIGGAKNLSARMADSTMTREGLLTARWSYDYGVVWRGMEALYARTGDKRYFEYIKDAMDAFVDGNGGIRDYALDSYNLDYVCNGRQLLFLYKATGEEKYLRAARTLRTQLECQPRTSDGGFWHKKCYPYQMWLDGLHMAEPFYLEYALLTGEGDETPDDIALQLTLAYRHTLDAQTGLNRHAWDERRAQPWADKQTGLAPHAWGRAVGWYMMALCDVLEILPRAHRAYAGLLDIFRALCDKMLSVRVNLLWQQVLDCPDRPENYLESSGSCMMVYAMLKGARLGLVGEEIAKQARASYDALVTRFVCQKQNGDIFLIGCCQCAGLGGAGARDGTFEYYMSEPVIAYDLKGTGAFIQAACEAEAYDERVS